MIYKREKYRQLLDSLIGDQIRNIYYYMAFDGFNNFNSIIDTNIIQEVPIHGIYFETYLGKKINIVDGDYSSNYNLGGLDIFDQPSNIAVFNRPKQSQQEIWTKFLNREITSYSLVENIYRINNKEQIIPFGLCLMFNSLEKLYILNMGIEEYNNEDKRFEFSRGGGNIVIAFATTIFKGTDVLENNYFDIR